MDGVLDDATDEPPAIASAAPALGKEGGAAALALESQPTIGYASQQNAVPVVRTITLSNASETALNQIELEVSSLPAFVQPARFRFERLEPGEFRRLHPVDLQIDHGYLTRLDEAERGSIVVRAIAAGQVIAETASEVEILAYDQWGGTRSLPELLAAFCMPNAQAVDRLRAQAAELLRQQLEGVTLNGYQSKHRERVWQQCAAIYSAICAQGLHYSEAPASFGSAGQKIRTPDRVVDGKVATCLDLAMLFASCLEQSGLNAVVLITERHAFVACWLVPSSFPTTLVEDAQSIRKRIATGELIAFETTFVAQAHKLPLRAAVAKAREHLERDEDFRLAVDIRRAREEQIRPLPSRGERPQATQGGAAAEEIPVIDEAPDLPPLDPDATSDAPLEALEVTPQGRLEKWKGKLLDLTLRNRLLNFRPTKTTLRILCNRPAALEDALTTNANFRIRSAPTLMEGDDPRMASAFQSRTGRRPIEALIDEALGRRELLVEGDAQALDGRLLELFSSARTALEESGSNTLFLALGMLRWKEAPGAESAHRAPILLIPMTLERQSVRSGFVLARSDEEALVNPSLLQMLRVQFDLNLRDLAELTVDEQGLHVDAILQRFRLPVTEAAGWEVLDEVYLGNFSFARYVMWRDLQDRSEQLKASPVVKHLIDTPGETYEKTPRVFDAAASLDDLYRPQDVYAPLLTDTSQLRVLVAAAEGRDLVVIGPPGTGKSQSIVNLISHLLASGKSVLFVSEKLAALEVVHRRLTQVGLAPFCLELHSAKSKKADVLKQLGAVLDLGHQRTVAEWERQAAQLASMKQELNAVAAALHRDHRNGLTIHQALGWSVRYADTTPAAMPWTEPDVHGRAELDALRETARQISALAAHFTDVATHPLREIRASSWSPGWQDALLGQASHARTAITALQQTAEPLGKLFGVPVAGASVQLFESLDELANLLLLAPGVPSGLASGADNPASWEALAALSRHGRRRNELRAAIGPAFDDRVDRLGGEALAKRWAQAKSRAWPLRWFAVRAVAKEIALTRTDGARPPEADIDRVCTVLPDLNQEDVWMAAHQPQATALLGEVFRGVQTDWEAVDRARAWAERFTEITAQVGGPQPEAIQALRDRLRPAVSTNRALLRNSGAIGAQLVRLRDTVRQGLEASAKLGELAGIGNGFLEPRNGAGFVQRVLSSCDGWSRNARGLQNWCYWRRIRDKAIAQGLGGLVSAMEAGGCPVDQVAEFFEYSYRNWFLKKAIDHEPVLLAFSSIDHARKIDEFRKADANFEKLTQQYVVAKLAANIPQAAGVPVAADSEMGTLRRELNKQRNHMPVRQLVRRLPTLLQKLKPCLLMSPLSVAQYLEPDHGPQFDVVIMDEASQIPVWDAVGAMARGNQVIVAGDPRQLPPTNFFQRADTDDVTVEETTEDLESILDELLGSGVQFMHLNVHYRSRYESLIAFSNRAYYESKLITFPSPITEDRAVSLRYVPGIYDRGKSRTNRAEAEAIVNEIDAHFSSPSSRELSLGVVTFNLAQQHLIEALLDERRRQKPELDQVIAAAMTEPLLVKALETIQGDERDVLLFSICYGPDAAGRVTMNFGPLNQQGGERRLNVAITRARHKVLVVSSLMPEQIDLSRVRARGVEDLKQYLDYAVRGRPALFDQAVATGLEADSPFEEEVARALCDRGWTVHPQVGVSGYRIDIGVVDPRTPGRYLLGIECDGAMYHSAKEARERDRLRQLVLERLGWKLHRVWSTDWWVDRHTQVEKLHQRLEALLAEEIDDCSDAAGTPAEAPPPAPAAPEAHRTSIRRPAVRLDTYRPVTPRGGRAERFYEPSALQELRKQMTDIIEKEGPIARQALYRRMARAWSLERTGARIMDVLDGALPPSIEVTRDRQERFFWPSDKKAGQWEGFRVAAAKDPESRRAVDEVALEEIGNLLVHILRNSGAMPVGDAIRTAARMLGINRAGSDVQERIGLALERLVNEGKASAGQGVVRLS